MAEVKRVIWIVLDSVGIGELPDADKFGDVGSNTLCNTAKAVGGLKIPNMVQLSEILRALQALKNVNSQRAVTDGWQRFLTEKIQRLDTGK